MLRNAHLMRMFVAVIIVTVTGSISLAAPALIIDFEQFNLGGQLYLDVPETLLFNNVGGSGVDVTIIAGADNRVYDVFQYGGDPSATGQALIDWYWPYGSNPVGTTILFNIPLTSFSLRAGDFGSDDDSPLKITAFNAQNQIIGQDSVPWYASSFPPFATLSVSVPGIRKVIYNSGGSYTNSTFIDDLTFVPEPATLLLLGLGGLIIGRLRFKN